MTTYLSFKGTNEGITVPSMTWDTIVIDSSLSTNTNTTSYVIDTSSRSTQGYMRYATNGSFTISGGLSATGQTMGTRSTTTATHTSQTSNFTLFARYDFGAANSATASVYDVKVYNGGTSGTLVAHYDMSTGTVNDQSGNGHNATLTGGTWLSDGTGGSNTTYAGSGSILCSSSLTQNEHTILSEFTNVNGQSSLTVAEQILMEVMGSSQGYSLLTSGDTIIAQSGSTYSGSGSTISFSVLTSQEVEKFVASGSLIGTSILNDNHNIMLFEAKGDIVVYPNLTSSETSTPHSRIYEDSGNIEGYSWIFTKEEIFHFSPRSFVGSIYLKGEEKINVYLVGLYENSVGLKGVIN